MRWPTFRGAVNCPRRMNSRDALTKHERRNTPALAIAGILLVALGAGAFAWWQLSRSTETQVSSDPTAVASDAAAVALPPGLPNTLAELDAWYVEPPEGQNAAAILAKGFEAIQISDADRNSPDLPIIGKGHLPDLERPLPPRSKAVIFEFVRRNRPVLDALHESTAFNQARYPVDLNTGWEGLLAHLSRIKVAVQIAQLDVLLYADNRQPAAAAGGLLDMLSATQSLKDEPLLISQLVRVACLAIAKESQRTLNAVTLPDADLERLSGVLDVIERELSDGTAFTRALAGNRLMVLSAFELPREKPELFQQLGTLTAADLAGDLKPQQTFAERTFNRALLMRSHPFPERRLEVDAHFASAMAEAQANDFAVCMMLMRLGNEWPRREAAGLATIRRMGTALALERYRSATGNLYPWSLDQLVPAFLEIVPQDPFDGKPLHYARDGAGYEMRSSAEPARAFKVVKRTTR
jgi:hypothetical protein